MSNEFPFQWPVRVYYEDTDTGGVVYYANYLKFYERARTEAVRFAGFSQEQMRIEQNTIFVVSNVNVNYRRPAVLDDELQVRLKVTRMARTYLVFSQQIVRGEEVLGDAEVRVACVSADSMKPRPIPEKMKEQLSVLL